MKTLLAGLMLALGATAAQAADTFPSKPVHLIVAAAPGGSVDLVTRLVAQKMSDNIGQPVVVENRAGADTLIGIRYVKSMPADGYTVLATSSSITMQPVVKLDPGYDLLTDFVPIGMMSRSPWAMVVGAGQPDRTVADFIARGKANPDALSFASGGVGTAPFMGASMFLQQAGLKLLHVPYKGNGAAIPDVISGRVTMIFEGVSSSAELIRAGQLRALGVSSEKRLAAFPNVPTIAEQGFPGFSNYFFTALFAPAGTPPDVIERLSRSMLTATSELRSRFESDGFEAPTASPSEFTGSIKRDLISMAELVTKLGMKKE